MRYLRLLSAITFCSFATFASALPPRTLIEARNEFKATNYRAAENQLKGYEEWLISPDEKRECAFMEAAITYYNREGDSQHALHRFLKEYTVSPYTLEVKYMIA